MPRFRCATAARRHSRAIRSTRTDPSTAFTLVELLVVIIIIGVLLACLLPSLSTARRRAAASKLAANYSQAPAAMQIAAGDVGPNAANVQPPGAPVRPPAHVKKFDADVVLTPRLSVGTAEPESIYEVNFEGKMDVRPAAVEGAPFPAGARGVEHEVLFPLPPQIISLADLTVKMNGEPSDSVFLRGDKLVWHGRIDPAGPAAVECAYSAVGQGLFTLETPPGKIVDQFRIALRANGSDVRMLELSLQPTSLKRVDGATQYVWDYPRLMFGRPIALDVLGVAPVDRLGELRWLGPMSVIVLGIIVGLFAHAFGLEQFDRGMLLLVLGTFAGAYPMMYFLQEFIPLNVAMFVCGGGVLLVILVRTATVIGVRYALPGVALPAGLIMWLTLTAAIRPQYQGILLTGLALGLFTVAMLLAPRLHAARAALRAALAKAVPPPPPPPCVEAALG
jgi:prepilin-type N-terminal cleavage/methylation domain-containing protein